MSIKSLRNGKVWIIAEIGINHEGSLDRCFDLVECAAAAGANAVKLQTITPHLNYHRETKSYELFSEASLTFDETASVFEFSRSCGVEPFTTVGDLETLSVIAKMSPACFKISSGLLTCTPLIEEVVNYKLPVILSGGMTGVQEALEASKILEVLGNDFYAFLHCVSLYPPPDEEVNLAQINYLKSCLSCDVGYSDHSGDPDIPALAVAAGAQIIEAHLTFDCSRDSFDHAISLDQPKFTDMVSKVRKVEKLMGSPSDRRSDLIQGVRKNMGRYLASLRGIKKGEPLTCQNTGFLRFNKLEDLVEAKHFKHFQGKNVVRDLDAFEPIRKGDIIND